MILCVFFVSVLQPVFVSAGQNQVIQLPQDEATLSAVLMENGKSIQPSGEFEYCKMLNSVFIVCTLFHSDLTQLI